MDANSIQEALQTYEYEALPTDSSIRLVSLRPTPERPHDICVSLGTVDLEDKPKYHTLSYTWGNPRSIYRADETIPTTRGQERVCAIYCDNKSIPITKNLQALLIRWQAGCFEYFQSVMRESFDGNRSPSFVEAVEELWIDAICMNQQDLSERTAQVKLMATIYHAATGAWIWLGEDDWSTERGLKLCKHLSELSLEDAKDLADVDFTDPRWTELLKAEDEDYLAMSAMLNREWFHRTWIVQEVVLSSSPWFMCGGFFIAPGSIIAAVRFLNDTRLEFYIANYYVGREFTEWRAIHRTQEGIFAEIEETPRKFVASKNPPVSVGRHIYSRLYNHIQRFDGKIPRFHFRDMLAEMRWTEATDPRDKIFSSLGFARKCCYWPKPQFEVEEFQVDYHKSCSDIYLGIAWYILSTSRGLDLLSHVQDPVFTLVDNLPSWVPDWSVKPQPNRLMSCLSGGADRCVTTRLAFNASNGIQWCPVHVGSESLTLQGYKLDCVINAAILNPQMLDGMGEIYTGHNVVPILSSLPQVYPWAWSRTKVSSEAADTSYLTYVDLSSGAKGPRTCKVAIVNSDDTIEVPMVQSRVEALWRTMIADTCRGQHPAPLSVGYGFGDWVAIRFRDAIRSFHTNNIRASLSEHAALIRDKSK